ncbi:hypothetical protein [Longimicrobium sp.]|uniref:hypothetical protein n=1 Tax=Longimicrobium sp. TaxID=2029185 RepID=UPI003B3ABBB3
MNTPAYHPLSRAEVALLLAPENKELELAWDRVAGALHGVVAMLSITYPRPLYYYEDAARRTLAEEPERLRGTPFHAAAVRNVQAAEEIERMFQEQGHTPELHQIVDRYLDTLLDEFDSMRLYPDVPPQRALDEENGLAGYPRAVAGR